MTAIPDKVPSAQPKDVHKTYELLQRTIIFIYDSIEGIDEPSFMEFPKGTGFLLCFPVDDQLVSSVSWNQGFYYLITNKHLLHARSRDESGEVVWKKSIFIRFNHLDRSCSVFKEIFLQADGDQQNVFLHSSPEVDLAAIKIETYPELLPFGFAYDMILDKDEFRAKVHLGSSVQSVGYMPGYAGLARIHPAVRFGRVSLLTEETWWASDRASLPRGMRENAFVVEISARGGCSGSAVVLDVGIEDVGSPMIVGVLKGSVESSELEHQGLAAIEPPHALLELADELFNRLKGQTRVKLLGRERIERS